jgi:hypothetical protein
MQCGCGKKAEWEVYSHLEPHCNGCMEEATDCNVPILVRKIDLAKGVEVNERVGKAS